MDLRRVVIAPTIASLLALAVSPAVIAGTPGTETTVVSVLNLNIFYGGDELNLRTGTWCAVPDGCSRTFDQVVHVIEESTADIVGIEEGERNAGAIADALGWYASDRTQVISRFPIVDPPGANGRYVWVEVLPGRFVAIGNVHLPSDPYGPYEIRDGATLEETIELENSVRLPAIQPYLEALPPLVDAGFPTFLVGDFNSPSHLDWTPEVSAVRPEVPFPVDWPVSRALADAGFRDSYRESFPDPVEVPGFTWTPGGPESIPDEVHDRIDWVLASGPAETLGSTVVGEDGGPDVAIGFDPWPTDHRGVLSEFEVTPAVPDPFVAVGQRRVFKGDRIPVRYRTADEANQSVAIVPRGKGPARALKSKAVGPPGAQDWSLGFRTRGLEPGDYDVVLISGGSIVSRSPFWLYRRGTETKVWATEQTFLVGAPIRVRWRAAPGFRWDWLGVYAADRTASWRYLLYDYTKTKVEGVATIGPDAFPGLRTWPLKPGRYRIKLLIDDSYRTVAVSATFRIVEP